MRVLTEHGVRFVVIGGIAGAILGSPTVTADLDVCYSRDRPNLRCLAAALASLHARLRGAPSELVFIIDEASLHTGDSFTLVTDAGDLDILATPSGTAGFDDLVSAASEYEVGEDLRVLCASIDDLIRMKKAAGRPKDRVEVEILSALRGELNRGDHG